MKIIVTEQQYIKLINEVNRSFDYSESEPRYDYKSIKLLPTTGDSNNFIIFFNGTVFNKSEYKKPNEPQYVEFFGPQGNFEFHKDDIFFKGKTPFTFLDKVKYEYNQYYNKLYDLIDKTQLVKKNKITEINSWDIRKALELAFSSKTENNDGIWVPGDNKIFTSGVRNVYTIGSKLGTEETWSILNYFDTKREIQKKIVETYNNDTKTELGVINWLIEKLKNNDSFIDYLVDEIQWPSIDSGLETEKLAEEIIGANNATFYPPGSVMDRWKGVDMTYEGINYQIKPLKSYDEKTNTVITYGMRDYKDKELVHKILFVSSTKMLEFDNKGYSSTFSNVVFDSPPTKIYNVTK